MPSLFKPTIISYTVDEKARANGERVTKTTPGAIRHKRKAKVYYGRFKDGSGQERTVPLCADRATAKQMLAKLVTDSRLAAVGLGDTFAAYRERPLLCPLCESSGKAHDSACFCPASPHLTDYRRSLQARGNVSAHIAKSRARIAAQCNGCNFTRLADIAPDPVLEWLAEQRRDGMSVSTSNGYLAALRSFTRWLCMSKRLPTDPLAHLPRLNAKPHLAHVRRALGENELRALLDAADLSAIVFRGLNGQDRRLLYALAMGTGLRASELASLTPRSFSLDSRPPVVFVRAAYTKNRRDVTQPLPDDLAELLRAYLHGKPDQPLWPGTWNLVAAEMLRIDLEAARQTWIDESQSASERERREKSDRLTYRDASGRVADFHALRHSYITLLSRSGVSPKHAQELARHSDIRLTMNVYTHAELYDLAGAVGALPRIFGGVGDNRPPHGH